MKATIEKGELIIRIPVLATPADSKTGKSKILATTGGNKDVALTLNGVPTVVKIGVNAYIPN